MANKFKGTFSVAANYQVKMADALDPRVQWDSYEDLMVKSNWPADGDIIYAYNGLVAAVGEELWMLVDKDRFVDKLLNSVGVLNELTPTIVRDDDGTSEVSYKTSDVASLLGWKIVGRDSNSAYSVDEHCLIFE